MIWSIHLLNKMNDTNLFNTNKPKNTKKTFASQKRKQISFFCGIIARLSFTHTYGNNTVAISLFLFIYIFYTCFCFIKKKRRHASEKQAENELKNGEQPPSSSSTTVEIVSDK